MQPPAHKKTRIVATLGPASSNPEVIARLVQAGVDVCRINMSHGTADAVAATVETVRRVSNAAGYPVGILLDLRGPRIRLGEVAGGTVEVRTGERLVLTPEPAVGTAERMSVSFPALARDLAVGAHVLIDDGNIDLEVTELPGSGDVVGRIVRGGPITSRRGLNIPGRPVSLPAVTEKDRADVALGIALDVDFFALSFVQSPSDVQDLAALIAARGGHQRIIAKIERANAVADVEAIAHAAYGIMVARGDLALEMSAEDTPIAQKRIMRVCRSLDRPVITATQMLESMTHAPKPTRAEAADVVNAVLDGTDAVMLSGETAIGTDPVRVVETMHRLVRRAEQAMETGELRRPPEVASPPSIREALARASWQVAEEVGAAVILVYTRTGEAAIRVATHRPLPVTLALCPDQRVCRRLSVAWGIRTAVVDIDAAARNLREVALRAAVESGVAHSGDEVVITAGSLFAASGATDIVKVDRVP